MENDIDSAYPFSLPGVNDLESMLIYYIEKGFPVGENKPVTLRPQ